MQTDRAAPARPAFQSLTLRSLAVIAVAAVANRAGLALPDGFAHTVVQTAIDLATTLGVLGAVIGRARAKTPIA